MTQPPREARFKTLLAALALGLLLLVAPAAADAAGSTDQDVAYQLDSAHDGFQTADPITAPLSQVWSDTLPEPSPTR